MKAHDLSGQKFNHLTAQHRCEPPKEYSKSTRNVWWMCLCDCGNTKPIRAIHLKRDQIKSCGCLKKRNKPKNGIIHGYYASPTYNSWRSMIQRCTNENNIGWKTYGGKGIKVCDRWQGKKGFIHFLEDMGERPENLSLDRIDSDKGYYPENCRWATRRVQTLNTTRTNWITYGEETLCLSDWAKKLNKDRKYISDKLRNGWTMEQIINKVDIPV